MTGLTYQKLDTIAEVLRGLPAPAAVYPTEEPTAKPAAKRTRPRKTSS
jgi:hypothetical protein